MSAADKIRRGLQDALDGNFAGATFYGIDRAEPGSEMNGVYCPRCDAGHTWPARTAPPKWCVGCGLEFKFPEWRGDGEQARAAEKDGK